MIRDRIIITGIRALGTIGVLPEERDRRQPFEVDLELELPLARAGLNDDLSATVDYGDVINKVVRSIETGGFQLLEALAEAIADDLLNRPTVGAVTVEVRKVRPPVPADVASVGVKIHRTRL